MAAKFENRKQKLAFLGNLPQQVKKVLSQALSDSANEISAMQKALCPVDTGDLKSTIRVVKGNAPKLASSASFKSGGGDGDPDLTYWLVVGPEDAKASGWYARYIEFGTAPHVIKPKNSQGSLHIDGHWLAPGRAVQHPGSTARPFFFPPYRAMKSKVRRRAVQAIKTSIKDSVS